MNRELITFLFQYELAYFLGVYLIAIIFIYTFRPRINKIAAYGIGALVAFGITWYDVIVGSLIRGGFITETQNILFINKVNLCTTLLISILFCFFLFGERWYVIYSLYFIFITLNSLAIVQMFGAYINDDNGIQPVTWESLPAVNYIKVLCILAIVTEISYVIISKTRLYELCENISKRVYVIFISVLFLFALSVSKNYIPDEKHSPYEQNYLKRLDVWSNALQVIILLAILIILVLYGILLVKNKQVKREVQLLNEKEKVQYESIIELQSQELQIRKMYHDIGNHIKTMNILIANGDTEEAKNCIERMGERYRKAGQSFYTGNKIINAIMIQKVKKCEKNGILVTSNICIPEQLMVEEIDLMSIFSNLMENAIDACLQCEEESRYINVDIYIKQSYVVLKVVNSKNPNIHLKKSKGEFISTKIDRKNHGYGIRIINEIVNKYDGLKEYSNKEDEFEVVVMLQNEL